MDIQPSEIDASFDRFDICLAHLALEWDYNVGGWLQERPSNRRRMEATAVQLDRMHFKPGASFSGYDSLEENARSIYLKKVIEWKLPVDAALERDICKAAGYPVSGQHKP